MWLLKLDWNTHLYIFNQHFMSWKIAKIWMNNKIWFVQILISIIVRYLQMKKMRRKTKMILHDSYFLTIQIQWYNRKQCRQFFPVGSKWVFWKQLNWMVAWHLTITFEIIYILLIIFALEAISMPCFVPSYLNVQHFFATKNVFAVW